MNIKFNDKLVEVPDSCSISQFAQLQSIPDKGVALAVNFEIIQKALWPSTILKENDDIIIIKAVCGG